jgi:tetratricopeptide (TPR) repeat protein
VAGSHRYQYWQVALHAFDSSPWKGIGPGTFQYYWAQHQTLGEFVLNAHSLWIETMAELGVIGLALIAGFFVWVLLSGSVRALRAPLETRALRVGALAAVAAFCASAAFDWVWQIGAVPVVTMLLCAVCVGGAELPGRSSAASRARRAWPVRLGLGVAALIALWTIVVPLASTVEVRSSQAAAQRGDFAAALRAAADAQQVEPGAASPRLQRALLLEQLGDIPAAAAAVAQAEARSPWDWQIWLVASRIATEQDQPRVALSDWRRAKSLNPRSPIFGG